MTEMNSLNAQSAFWEGSAKTFLPHDIKYYSSRYLKKVRVNFTVQVHVILIICV